MFDISLTNIDNEQSNKILLKQIELLNCKVDNNKIDSNYLVESYEKLLENLNNKSKNDISELDTDTDNDEYFESLSINDDKLKKVKSSSSLIFNWFIIFKNFFFLNFFNIVFNI